MKRTLAAALCATLLACAACGSATDGSGAAAAPPPPREGEPSIFDRAVAEDPELQLLRDNVVANPDDPEAHRRLGLALRSAMLRQESLPHFVRATELQPNSSRYRLDLAAAYTSLARFEEAEEVYRGLLADPVLRATVLHNLGNLALRKDDLGSAIDYYERALRERPDYLLARYHHGVALQQTGEYDAAYGSFKKVLELPMPEDQQRRGVYFDAVYRLGSLDLTRGNPQRALEIFEQLLRYYEDHPNAWYGYGRALMVLGREDDARQAFRKHMQLPDRRTGRLGYVGSPQTAGVRSGTDAFRFVDATAAAGIDFVNLCGSPPGSKNWITETLGAGAGWLDYDGDGVLDLYLVNGSAHDRPANSGEPNRLLRGNGRGGFDDVTRQAGVGHRGWGHGVAIGDIDNDGDADLYVTNYGPNVLYRNDGDGTFSDVTASSGVGDERWGTSAAFFDLEGDGDLDLYVANYLSCDPDVVPRPGESTLCGFKGIPTLCGPKPLPPQQDVLYRNDGDGTFTDITAESGVQLDVPLYTLGVVTGDHDNDGDQDVYVANDSVRNLLWQNLGDGTLAEIGIDTMSAVGAEGRAQSGMGTALGDYDADGWLDIAVTNFSHDLNTIYRNVEGRYYVDESSALGMSVTNAALSWGVGFADFDNDGHLDLFIANGHIYPEMDDYDFGTTYRQINHVFRNEDDARLVELSAHAGPGLQIARSFRGAAFADYDDDGDVDVIVTAIDESVLLLENDSPPGGHYLKIALVGTRSNRDGVGARVTVSAGGRTQIRERTGGGSFLSSNDPRLHFGLGDAAVAERVEVRWPSGTRDVLEGVQADRLITVVESD